MKQFKLLAILALVFCFCFSLIACGESTDGNNETNAPAKVTEPPESGENSPETEVPEAGLKLPDGIDPEKFYKFVTFELLEGEPRQAVVDYMRKQAHVEWVPANDISLKNDLGSWGVDLTYSKGKTYHGMIYSNLNSSLPKFEAELKANNGRFRSDATSWEDIIGVGCCSAILNAIQQITNDVYGETKNFIPNGSNVCRAIKLGDYTVEAGNVQTDEIVAQNDEQTMYKAYSLLDVGDIIVKRKDGAPHIRMITEKATVVLSASGKVNPGRSYVKCIEQTNAFDKERTDGVLTTWREDKIYTFSKLRDSNYLPVTLAVYDTPETEMPYLALDEEITPDVLAKKSIIGVVSSNYPLKHIYIEVYNSNGTLAKQVVVGGFDDSFKVSLRSKAAGIFDGLSAGNYTLVIDAGIALGSAELCRVDFTVE